MEKGYGSWRWERVASEWFGTKLLAPQFEIVPDYYQLKKSKMGKRKKKKETKLKNLWLSYFA